MNNRSTKIFGVLLLVVGALFMALPVSAQTSDSGSILGEETDFPTSYTTVTTTNGSTTGANQSNSNTVAESNTGVNSPLVILCIVCGILLIVAIAAYLIFKRDDKDQ